MRLVVIPQMNKVSLVQAIGMLIVGTSRRQTIWSCALHYKSGAETIQQNWRDTRLATTKTTTCYDTYTRPQHSSFTPVWPVSNGIANSSRNTRTCSKTSLLISPASPHSKHKQIFVPHSLLEALFHAPNLWSDADSILINGSSHRASVSGFIISASLRRVRIEQTTICITTLLLSAYYTLIANSFDLL